MRLSPIPADNDVYEIAGFLVKKFTYYVFSEDLLYKNVDTVRITCYRVLLMELNSA